MIIKNDEATLRDHAETSRRYAILAGEGTYLGKPAPFWEGAAAAYTVWADEVRRERKEEVGKGFEPSTESDSALD